MVALSIKVDLKPLQKAFINLRAKQVPFASALAVNMLAKGVVAAEQAAEQATFKSPTPFTMNAFRIEVATKAKPVAVVAVKDIQAEYLEPYVVGGPRFLGTKRGMLAPRNIALNQYGNLTKGKLASLKGKPNIFIGQVKTRSGQLVNGVWQRPRAVGKGKSTGGLKLLIKFEDTTPAPKHLPFIESATAYVKRNAAVAFQAAMQKALSTAR